MWKFTSYIIYLQYPKLSGIRHFLSTTINFSIFLQFFVASFELERPVFFLFSDMQFLR